MIGGISYTKIQLATYLSLRELKEGYAVKAVISSFPLSNDTLQEIPLYIETLL